MRRIRNIFDSLLKPCKHDGLSTPLRTLRGAEIWRCELCGAELIFADEPWAAREVR